MARDGKTSVLVLTNVVTNREEDRLRFKSKRSLAMRMRDRVEMTRMMNIYPSSTKTASMLSWNPSSQKSATLSNLSKLSSMLFSSSSQRWKTRLAAVLVTWQK